MASKYPPASEVGMGTRAPASYQDIKGENDPSPTGFLAAKQDVQLEVLNKIIAELEAEKQERVERYMEARERHLALSKESDAQTAQPIVLRHAHLTFVNAKLFTVLRMRSAVMQNRLTTMVMKSQSEGFLSSVDTLDDAKNALRKTNNALAQFESGEAIYQDGLWMPEVTPTLLSSTPNVSHTGKIGDAKYYLDGYTHDGIFSNGNAVFLSSEGTLPSTLRPSDAATMHAEMETRKRPWGEYVGAGMALRGKPQEVVGCIRLYREPYGFYASLKAELLNDFPDLVEDEQIYSAPTTDFASVVLSTFDPVKERIANSVNQDAKPEVVPSRIEDVAFEVIEKVTHYNKIASAELFDYYMWAIELPTYVSGVIEQSDIASAASKSLNPAAQVWLENYRGMSGYSQMAIALQNGQSIKLIDTSENLVTVTPYDQAGKFEIGYGDQYFTLWGVRAVGTLLLRDMNLRIAEILDSDKVTAIVPEPTPSQTPSKASTQEPKQMNTSPVKYPKRKLGTSIMRIDPADNFSTETLAWIALSNMVKGDEFLLGRSKDGDRDLVQVATITDKTIKLLRNNQQDAVSYKVDSDKFFQLLRDVGDEVMGMHHGLNNPLLQNRLESDPAIYRLPNGVFYASSDGYIKEDPRFESAPQKDSTAPIQETAPVETISAATTDADDFELIQDVGITPEESAVISKLLSLGRLPSVLVNNVWERLHLAGPNLSTEERRAMLAEESPFEVAQALVNEIRLLADEETWLIRFDNVSLLPNRAETVWVTFDEKGTPQEWTSLPPEGAGTVHSGTRYSMHVEHFSPHSLGRLHAYANRLEERFTEYAANQTQQAEVAATTAVEDTAQEKMITPHDSWRGDLIKTRAYAKELIDAGKLDGSEAGLLWSKTRLEALTDLIDSSVGTPHVNQTHDQNDEEVVSTDSTQSTHDTEADQPAFQRFLLHFYKGFYAKGEPVPSGMLEDITERSFDLFTEAELSTLLNVAQTLNENLANETITRLTPSSVANLRNGDTVVDATGSEFMLVKVRHEFAEAYPIVNGHAEVFDGNSVRFHLNPESSYSYPQRRHDPIISTGRNYYDDQKGESAPCVVEPETDHFSTLLKVCADSVDDLTPLRAHRFVTLAMELETEEADKAIAKLVDRRPDLAKDIADSVLALQEEHEQAKQAKDPGTLSLDDAKAELEKATAILKMTVPLKHQNDKDMVSHSRAPDDVKAYYKALEARVNDLSPGTQVEDISTAPLPAPTSTVSAVEPKAPATPTPIATQKNDTSLASVLTKHQMCSVQAFQKSCAESPERTVLLFRMIGGGLLNGAICGLTLAGNKQSWFVMGKNGTVHGLSLSQTEELTSRIREGAKRETLFDSRKDTLEIQTETETKTSTMTMGM